LPAGREAEFEAWFQGEHLLSAWRAGFFCSAAAIRGFSGAPGYFNSILSKTPEVADVEALSERLDNPTPMTRKIMSEYSST